MTYWCIQKQALFIDEGFSYTQSNRTNNIVFSKEQACSSGEFLQKNMVVQSDNRFNYTYIKHNLIAHPPVFYIIFHTISSFFPNTFSLWFGLGLNLLLFSLTQIVLYKLSQMFLTDKRALLPPLLYGFSIPAICTVTFIRNYMLFTFETTLLCLLTIQLLNLIKNKQNINLHIELFCFLLFFGCLTHYYFFVFAFILCGGICFCLLLQKQYKNLLKFAGGNLISVVACPLIFPQMLRHLFGYERGFSQSILPTLDKSFNGGFSLKVFDNFLNNDFLFGLYPHQTKISLIIIIISILVGIYHFYKHKKLNENTLFLVTVFILCVIMVSAIMPLDVKRYFFNLMPLGILLFCLLLNAIFPKNKKNTIWQYVLCVFLILANLHNPHFEHYLYTDKTPQGHITTLLKDKTLYLKWLMPVYEKWRNNVPILYSFFAKDFIVFNDFNDPCYQQLQQKQLRDKAVLMIPSVADCETINGWINILPEDGYCTYISEETGENV